jgi:hypothetical protein
MFRHRRLARLLPASLVMVALAGCVSDSDTNKATTQFSQASDALTKAFSALLTSANLVEEDHYIDEQAFAGAPLNAEQIRAQDILTPDELRLRTSAIRALCDYTTALGTLAGGKPVSAMDADVKKADASLQSLAKDAAKAGSASSIAGPISAAVKAAGAVLELIEAHRAANDIRDSIRTNDPAVTELFALLSKESTDFYARQKSTLSDTGVLLLRDYNTAQSRTPADSMELLQLSNLIKQYEKDSAALAACDPSKAIEGFQKAHDALVKAILAPKSEQKKNAAEVIAAVSEFASDAMSLGEAPGGSAGSQ